MTTWGLQTSISRLTDLLTFCVSDSGPSSVFTYFMESKTAWKKSQFIGTQRPSYNMGTKLIQGHSAEAFSIVSEYFLTGRYSVESISHSRRDNHWVDSSVEEWSWCIEYAYCVHWLWAIHDYITLRDLVISWAISEWYSRVLHRTHSLRVSAAQ